MGRVQYIMVITYRTTNEIITIIITLNNAYLLFFHPPMQIFSAKTS